MATAKKPPAAGPAIAKGLAALAVLAGAWYFVGKGDRAFEASAVALRPVLSYEVRIRDSTSQADNLISVSCPNRFALAAQTGSGALKRVVIGSQAYAQVDSEGWIKVPMTMSGLPALSLCPQPAASSDDPKDLPALLTFLSRKARLESTSQSEAGGVPCTGWRAVPRGPDPEPKPLLTICISENSHLPVEMILGAATWTFSKWGEPQDISEPTVAPPPPQLPEPMPSPSP